MSPNKITLLESARDFYDLPGMILDNRDDPNPEIKLVFGKWGNTNSTVGYREEDLKCLLRPTFNRLYVCPYTIFCV